MKTDTEIQQDVMNELKREPTLKAAEIGVAVKDGVVTLSGYVDSLFRGSLILYTILKNCMIKVQNLNK